MSHSLFNLTICLKLTGRVIKHSYLQCTVAENVHQLMNLSSKRLCKTMEITKNNKKHSYHYHYRDPSIHGSL